MSRINESIFTRAWFSLAGLIQTGGDYRGGGGEGIGSRDTVNRRGQKAYEGCEGQWKSCGGKNRLRRCSRRRSSIPTTDYKTEADVAGEVKRVCGENNERFRGRTKNRKYNVRKRESETNCWTRLNCEGHLFTAGEPPPASLNQIYHRDKLWRRPPLTRNPLRVTSK